MGTIQRRSNKNWTFYCALSALVAVGCDRPKPKTVTDVPRSDTLVEVDMTPEPMKLSAEPSKPIIDKGSRVTFLGYHQVITEGIPDEMRILASKFRNQMQALKEAGIRVISLDNYMGWRRGMNALPENCVVITVDDGYDDLFEEVLPILKEFKYPFTFYLYTNFLGGSGRTLNDKEVRQLIAAGGQLGSHSRSHDFLVRAKRRLGSEEAYAQWLIQELKGSKDFLENRFGVPVTSFAYPYGEYSEDLAEKVDAAGYTSAVTVNGAKASFETPLFELPRYIIHGNNDINWKAGTSFGGAVGLAEDRNLLKGNKEGDKFDRLIQVWPKNGAEIVDRKPTIRADISRLGEIIPESLVMKVSGFGNVPVAYDPGNRVIFWKVTRNLRSLKYRVSLSFRRFVEAKEDVVLWSFNINRSAYYLPDYEQRVKAERALVFKPLDGEEDAPE